MSAPPPPRTFYLPASIGVPLHTQSMPSPVSAHLDCRPFSLLFLFLVSPSLPYINAPPLISHVVHASTPIASPPSPAPCTSTSPLLQPHGQLLHPGRQRPGVTCLALLASRWQDDARCLAVAVKKVMSQCHGVMQAPRSCCSSPPQRTQFVATGAHECVLSQARMAQRCPRRRAARAAL